MADTVLALKFLGPRHIGPYSGFQWPVPNDKPGAWVKTRGKLIACENGIHACKVDQIRHWVQAELYVIELDGRLIDGDDKLIAREGRLVRRVREWNVKTAQAFAEACAWRARDYAEKSVRRIGFVKQAKGLMAACDLAGLCLAARSAAYAAASADSAAAPAAASAAYSAADSAYSAAYAAASAQSAAASAAQSVAASAAQSAAASAAQSAAASARSAAAPAAASAASARSAAYSARSAAYSAYFTAYSAEIKLQSRWLRKHLKLEKAVL